jgi:hypothetical protein
MFHIGLSTFYNIQSLLSSHQTGKNNNHPSTTKKKTDLTVHFLKRVLFL